VAGGVGIPFAHNLVRLCMGKLRRSFLTKACIFGVLEGGWSGSRGYAVDIAVEDARDNSVMVD